MRGAAVLDRALNRKGDAGAEAQGGGALKRRRPHFLEFCAHGIIDPLAGQPWPRNMNTIGGIVTLNPLPTEVPILIFRALVHVGPRLASNADEVAEAIPPNAAPNDEGQTTRPPERPSNSPQRKRQGAGDCTIPSQPKRPRRPATENSTPGPPRPHGVEARDIAVT